MVFKSILSLSDRLSVSSILTNPTSSNIGVLGTLAWIVVCLIIFIPPLVVYFDGNYFQSQFLTSVIPSGQFYSGSDFKVAISFRNKIDGTYPNHAQIFDKLLFKMKEKTFYETYITDMELCQGGQFIKNTINPTFVKQCIKMPSNLLFDITQTYGYSSYIDFLYSPSCDDPFLCRDGSSAITPQEQFFIDLLSNNYYQIIFTSKVLDKFAQAKFQVHKVYSTEYNQDTGFLPYILFYYWQRQTFVDDSILPWKNNITHNYMVYSGKTFGITLTEEQAQAFGGLIETRMERQKYTTYRFYKKLDFIIGMLGGGIFLVFLFFWLPFSYINRSLQKIKNAEQLLLQKEGLLVNQNNLKAISIPLTFIFKNLIPGRSKQKGIIQEAEMEIDIIKLIKKVKVAHRNLVTNTINDTFVTKDIQFAEEHPSIFLPDRQILKTLNLKLASYQALKQSPETNHVYENNLTVMTIKQRPNIHQLSEQDAYSKKQTHFRRPLSCVSTIKQNFLQFIRFFDIFGAKPMFDAEPYSSSCWGFFSTCLIALLSVLTFALTIKNMDATQMFVSYNYQNPQDCNYELKTGVNYRIAVCFPDSALYYLQGAGKAARLAFYTNGTKNGYQQVDYIQMGRLQFQSYFQTDSNDPNNYKNASNCFKIADDIIIPFGGSPQTVNDAYFGFRLSPYCFGTPSTCAAIQATTFQNYLNFVNYYGFTVFMSQNQYSPSENRIISGARALGTSKSINILNATVYREQNYYLNKIEILDDRAHWLVRQPSILLEQTASYNPLSDKNLEQYGDPNMTPDYVLKLRPSGNKKSIILRNYKIDELFGIIGGVFVFWYFFVHIFAKRFNHFKLRAKLAQILYRQDAIDQSPFVQFLHLTNIPVGCCGTQFERDVQRVKLTEKKIINDLNYLDLVKYVDNCYRLSSSFFNSTEAKDLSLIYFKQKIDESQKVYLQTKTKANEIIFEDDQFLEFDNDDDDEDMRSRNGVANEQFIPQESSNNLPDLDKYLNRPAGQKVSINDPDIPYHSKNSCLQFLKSLDVFKNPAQLTLNGQRDVKSIFGGILFFILLLFIILVAQYFVGIYLRGDDYTISYERYVDTSVNLFSQNDQLGQISPGITITTGLNFKFAMSFYKNTHFYPYNVSSYFEAAGPLGLKIINVTTTRNNGAIQISQTSIDLVPCTLGYVDGWISQYADPQYYGQSFRNAFCVPDGYTYLLKSSPQGKAGSYFKIGLYNKYRNSSGATSLNQFTGIYYTRYYMSVPVKNILQKEFSYEMSSFSLINAYQQYPVQRNLTFSKLIYTDQYYSKSRQTYNDENDLSNDSPDTSSLSTENTHNLTFYYSSIIERYTLDYPGGAQLFGIVGGIIVFFIFGFGCCVGSFDNYKMKYQIGKKLYRFDKTSTGVFKDSKKKRTNLKKIQDAVKHINNYNQLQVLWAWILNPIAYVRSNYNFDKTLRRITLLQQKVDKDINLFSFYSLLNGIRDAINKKIKLSHNPDVKICSIYSKHLHNQEITQVTVSSLDREIKKHNLSPYQQIKISKAMEKRLNPALILGGNKSLNRAFGLQQGTSVTGTTNNQSLVQQRTGYDGLNNSMAKMKQQDIQHEQQNQRQPEIQPFDKHFQIEQN